MISNFEKEVCELVMLKRRESGKTQTEVDSLMGFEGSYIAKVESKIKSVNLDHINKLAEIFNCSPKDFLPNKYIKE